jgi:hypothetical protein
MGTPKIFQGATMIITAAVFMYHIGTYIPSQSYLIPTNQDPYNKAMDNTTQTPFYDTKKDREKDIERIEILFNFSANLLEGMEDLDPKLLSLTNKYFSQLV